MSKEMLCSNCKKKVITEREDTTHTTYSVGLCEDCKPKPEPEPEPEPQIEQDEPNPLACKECDFVAKSEFGLKSHMRKHESK